jgi:hypothetical protein
MASQGKIAPNVLFNASTAMLLLLLFITIVDDDADDDDNTARFALLSSFVLAASIFE